MFERSRSLLLVLIAGAVLGAADNAQPPAAPAAGGDAPAAKPAAAKPAPLQFVGTIQAKKGVVLRVVMDPKAQKEAKDKEPQPFTIGDQTKITIDGKDGTLKKLQAEMKVTITYDATGVISVDATSAKKKK